MRVTPLTKLIITLCGFGKQATGKIRRDLIQILDIFPVLSFIRTDWPGPRYRLTTHANRACLILNVRPTIKFISNPTSGSVGTTKMVVDLEPVKLVVDLKLIKPVVQPELVKLVVKLELVKLVVKHELVKLVVELELVLSKGEPTCRPRE